MTLDLQKFWVLTRPTKQSTMADILFETDLSGLRLQFLGGLDPLSVVTISNEELALREYAKQLLKEKANG